MIIQEKEPTDKRKMLIPNETYVETVPVESKDTASPLTLNDIQTALESLPTDLGLRVRKSKVDNLFDVTGVSRRRVSFACTSESLERDLEVKPLSPQDQFFSKLYTKLARPGERLPLIIESYQEGSFRTSIAYWVLNSKPKKINSIGKLRKLLEAWDGIYPGVDQWKAAQKTARKEAKEFVSAMCRCSDAKENRSLELQVAAARLRLTRELGRYLICVGSDIDELNDKLSQQMSRDIASARRLKKCIDFLGGYPEWLSELRNELVLFREAISEDRRQARLLGSEIDAALDDPRWRATLKSQI